MSIQLLNGRSYTRTIFGTKPNVITYTGTGRKAGGDQYTYPDRLNGIHNLVDVDIRSMARLVRIMDIGIGACCAEIKNRGITTRKLAEKYSHRMPPVEVYGVDVFMEGIREALSMPNKDFTPSPPFLMENLRYIEADATKTLGVEPDSMDIVLCFDMLGHPQINRDKREIVNQVYAALRIGGIFYFNEDFIHPHDPLYYERRIKTNNPAAFKIQQPLNSINPQHKS